MVVIQMAKDFFGIRGRFQRTWIHHWIKRRQTGRQESPSVERDLIECSGEQRGFYLYDLPVEQLCGQINAALHAALENPRAHEQLIRVFASTASEDDLSTFLGDRPSLVVRDDMNDEERKKIEKYAEARNHVAYHVERAIDGLQIAMGSRWKLWLQATSIVLGVVFASIGVGMYWTSNDPRAAIRDALAVGLVAGYLAPVARDIVARIQGGAR